MPVGAGKQLALAMPQHGPCLPSTASMFLFSLSDLGGVLKHARSVAKKFLRRDEVTYENNAESNLKILRRNNMDINTPK